MTYRKEPSHPSAISASMDRIKTNVAVLNSSNKNIKYNPKSASVMSINQNKIRVTRSTNRVTPHKFFVGDGIIGRDKFVDHSIGSLEMFGSG